MKKITFLLSHLGYSGITSSVATLANALSEKYEVEIISVYRLYSEPVYDLNENIKVTYVSNEKPNKMEMKHYLKQKNFKMYFKGFSHRVSTGFIRYIKTPSIIKKCDADIIISTNTIYNKFISKYANKSAKKIAWEHFHHNGKKSYIKKLIKSCEKIDYLVCVSNELKESYEKYLPGKVFYIPNVLEEMPNKLSKLDSNNIVSVGKLTKEKSFDDLLRIFKKISNKNTDWKLNIIGDGLEKSNLLKLTEELKLDNKVVFHGYQDKEYIKEIMLNSSIYVMTSTSEGFGISLIEAMSYGVPCVSYTSARGATEIIDDKINGFLIDNRDEEEMINKVNELINDKLLRNKIGKAARKKSKEYYYENVVVNWNKLFNKRKKD